MKNQILSAAASKTAADLAVINGKIVNVYSGEIYDGGVAVSGDTIIAVGQVQDYIGPSTKVLDAKSNYITPGFIDAHIHPESSNMNIVNFARTIQSHGTTVIMTDLHEIGVVSDLEGIESVLKEAENTSLKIYLVVPSHVPLAPELETSAAHFTPEKIEAALNRKDAVGISEVIGTSVAAGKEELLETIEIARQKGKSIQGHLAGVSGKDMNVCLAAGITTDHESISSEDALERLRNGCFLMMREGSVSHDLRSCLKPILDHNLNTACTCIVTDDLDAIDAVEKGHLDESVRIALKEGIDFVTAIQMVTLNAARSFRVEHEVGGLVPGRRADINITTGPEAFEVLSTISGGKIFMENKVIVESYPKVQHNPCLLHTMHVNRKITAEDLMIRTHSDKKQVKVHVMKTDGISLLTGHLETELPVMNHTVQCSPEQDVLSIAQVERHGVNGNIGRAFISGFGLKSGAIASSIGHDNHNIIVVGTNFDDMAFAVNQVAKMEGGQVVVENETVLAALALPVCGLLSDLSADEIVKAKTMLNLAYQQLGGRIESPFMILSFICLASIPFHAVTDCGFIDVLNGKVIDPVIG